MSFWDFIRNYGTRLLGVLQGTVAVLCGMTGLIPDAHMKYWLAASAVLTYWRGQTNSAAISAANSIVASAAINAGQSAPLVKPQEMKK